MIKSKKNCTKTIAFVLVFFSFALFFLAGSYAFWTYQGNGNGLISINPKNGLEFKYKEGTNSINIADGIPMSDEEGILQEDYFEFNVSGKADEGFEIPYTITARKTTNANIDEAIKLGLTRITYNDHELYDVYASYGTMGLEACNSLADSMNSETNYNPDAKFECRKKYSVGDPAPDTYLIAYYYSGFSSLNECESFLNQWHMLGGSGKCVEDNNQYAIVYTYNSVEFPDKASCEADENFDPERYTCIRMFPDGVITEDMYEGIQFYGNLSDTLEQCQEEIYGYDQCMLRYPIGTKAYENIIKISNFNDLNQYTNDNIDLSNFTEKALYSAKVKSDIEYNETFRLRIWVDENTDFSQSKYNNATFGLTVNVYSEGKVKKIVSNDSPGLYNQNNVLVASWDELINDYGLDATRNYQYLEDFDLNYNSSSESYIITIINQSMLSYIIDNNPELASATKLVVGNITEVGEYAFAGLKNITEIVIADGVTDLGFSSFCVAQDLTDLYISGSVETIDSYAFVFCNQLANVVLDEDNQLQTVGMNAFFNTPWYTTESQNGTVPVYLGNVLIEEYGPKG